MPSPHNTRSTTHNTGSAAHHAGEEKERGNNETIAAAAATVSWIWLPCRGSGRRRRAADSPWIRLEEKKGGHPVVDSVGGEEGRPPHRLAARVMVGGYELVHHA